MTADDRITLPKPEDMFHIKGRGVVFLYGRDVEVGNVRSLVGEVIIVDEVEYMVAGVEHFAIECPGMCRHGFGLLVRNVVP